MSCLVAAMKSKIFGKSAANTEFLIGAKFVQKSIEI